MEKIGLYIHIPYCIKKCHYCSFNSYEGRGVPDAYVSALLAEMKWASDLYSLKGSDVDSVYFGGGTPSLLEAGDIDILMNCLAHLFNVDAKAEVSLEINPATVDKAKLRSYKLAGINRASIGVQSFNNQYLNVLGRAHNGSDARSAVSDAVGAGFDNISMDLIFAIEGQTTCDLVEDIKDALSFDPKHFSLYLLSLEKGTPLFEMANKGRFSPADDVTQETMFWSASQYLADFGFVRYETSNYAKRGFESVHNMKYWTGATYLGFGAGAHTYLNDAGWGLRSWNLKNPEQYIRQTVRGKLPVEGLNLLSRKQAIMEAVFTSLRTKEGLKNDLIRERFDVDTYEVISQEAIKYLPDGLVAVDKEGVKFTKEGALIADEIVARILI